MLEFLENLSRYEILHADLLLSGSRLINLRSPRRLRLDLLLRDLVGIPEEVHIPQVIFVISEHFLPSEILIIEYKIDKTNNVLLFQVRSTYILLISNFDNLDFKYVNPSLT